MKFLSKKVQKSIKNSQMAALRMMFVVCTVYTLFAIGVSHIHAAQLYFDTQEMTVGTSGQFVAALNITAEESVNTLSVAIPIPEEFTILDVSTGNSVVPIFIEKPTYDEQTRVLTFSGLIPGGFQGKGGRLVTIFMRANPEKMAAAKEVTLQVSARGTKVYLNLPEPREDSLILKAQTLPVVVGKENIKIDIPDYEIPESFVPEITDDPLLGAGHPVVVFTTTDKQSGVAHYEVAESLHREDFDNLRWEKAESPHALRNVRADGYVYVKAVDQKGNYRIETVEPLHRLSMSQRLIPGILIAFLCLLLALGVVHKRNQKLNV
jgi:hypothetical protein